MKPETKQRLLTIVMWSGDALVLVSFLWSIFHRDWDLSHLWLSAAWAWSGLFLLLGVNPTARKRSKVWRVSYGLFNFVMAGIMAGTQLFPIIPIEIVAPAGFFLLAAVLLFIAVVEQREHDREENR